LGTAPPDLEVVPYGPSLFYLAGELDLSSAPRLRDEIGDAVLAGGLITIDVSALRFIDGAGMRAIRDSIEAMPSGCCTIHGASEMFLRLADILDMRQIPRLHLQRCANDPFPRATSSTAPDPVAGLQALRARS
jgi:anti-anti-sigma regulatory factor